MIERRFDGMESSGSGTGLLEYPAEEESEVSEDFVVAEESAINSKSDILTPVETVSKKTTERHFSRPEPDLAKVVVESKAEPKEKFNPSWFNWYIKYLNTQTGQPREYQSPANFQELKNFFEQEAAWAFRHQKFLDQTETYIQSLNIDERSAEILKQDIELIKASYGSAERVRVPAKADFAEKLKSAEELFAINQENELRNRQISYVLEKYLKPTAMAQSRPEAPKQDFSVVAEDIEPKVASAKGLFGKLAGKLKGFFSRPDKTESYLADALQEYRDCWQRYQLLLKDFKARGQVKTWEKVYQQYNQPLWQTQREIDGLKNNSAALKTLQKLYLERNQIFTAMNKDLESSLE